MVCYIYTRKPEQKQHTENRRLIHHAQLFLLTHKLTLALIYTPLLHYSHWCASGTSKPTDKGFHFRAEIRKVKNTHKRVNHLCGIIHVQINLHSVPPKFLHTV